MGLLYDYGLVLLLSEGSVRRIYGFEGLVDTTLPVIRILDRGDDRRGRDNFRAMQGLGLASIALPLGGGPAIAHVVSFLVLFFFIQEKYGKGDYLRQGIRGLSDACSPIRRRGRCERASQWQCRRRWKW